MGETMHQARQEAGEVARTMSSTGKERAGELASTAGEQAETVARDASEQAREVLGKSRAQLHAQASDQTARLASTLRDVGDQIRSMTRGEQAPDGAVTNVAGQIADTVSRTASRLDEGGIDGALDDVKRFARNHPVMFLAGALGAGFVLGRAMKSIDTGAVADAAKGERDEREDDMVAATGTQTGLETSQAESSAPAPVVPGPTTSPHPYSPAGVDQAEEMP
ncbi:MAG TPA: hypothetical protein VF183_07810 [Acidimicrobiales bacterium]